MKIFSNLITSFSIPKKDRRNLKSAIIKEVKEDLGDFVNIQTSSKIQGLYVYLFKKAGFAFKEEGDTLSLAYVGWFVNTPISRPMWKESKDNLEAEAYGVLLDKVSPKVKALSDILKYHPKPLFSDEPTVDEVQSLGDYYSKLVDNLWAKIKEDHPTLVTDKTSHYSVGLDKLPTSALEISNTNKSEVDALVKTYLSKIGVGSKDPQEYVISYQRGVEGVMVEFRKGIRINNHLPANKSY